MDVQETLARLKAIAQANTGTTYSGTTWDELLKARVDSYNNTVGDLTGYDCPICKNKGSIEIIKNGESVIRRCKCMDVRESIHRIKKSGLMRLIDRYTLDNYNADEPWQKNIKQAAQEYVKAVISGGNNWFLLSGQPGGGKTHICTAIAGQLLKHGIPVQYMLWRDEVVRLKSLVNDYDAYQSIIDKLKSVKVLYIDDFLKTKNGTDVTAGDINAAFEIINNRYIDPNLITLLSSEKDIDSITLIDEAIGSRIVERAEGYCKNILRAEGRNYRLKKR